MTAHLLNDAKRDAIIAHVVRAVLLKEWVEAPSMPMRSKASLNILRLTSG
jgi:hypothetical protein